MPALLHFVVTNRLLADTFARVLAQNLSTALITEDDIDWDVRIKSQLDQFAAGTRALTQPLKKGGYADTTLETRGKGSNTALDDLKPGTAPDTVSPQLSPYGDNWDVLWLGHCGVRLPNPQQEILKGRYCVSHDETVPSWEHRTNLAGEFVKNAYSDHTRIIHHAMSPICTLAYAVSVRGAQRSCTSLVSVTSRVPWTISWLVSANDIHA